MANTYLTRTPSTAGNRKTWTMSYWVKRSNLDSNNIMFQTLVSTYTWCRFDGSQRFEFQDGNGGHKITTMKFRDTSAWYHIVVVIDTDNATADDRYKIYINGERITAFDTSTNPSQGYEGEWNKAQEHNIGRHGTNGTYNYNGLMSHYHFIDGTAYTASDFGEYDANGVWKINTSPSVTYGTNGFFILKNGNSVTDQSGNSNNFTVGGGTLTNTEDCPSNVFATFNPLHFGDANSSTYGTFSNGNTSYASTQPGSPYPYSCSTLATSSGKWYAEFKLTSLSTSAMIGITDGTSDAYIGDTGTNDACLFYNGNFYPGASSFTSAFSDNDIIQIAMDLDNNYVYFGKNGTWLNSGDPTSGVSGTGAKTIPTSSTGVLHFAFGDAGGGTPSCSANFGNGYFGTTAVSSAGTNASGIGIFEYDVPTGYTALSTKGLNL